MNTKEKLEVMQAFLDGKVIQVFDEHIKRDWIDFCSEPNWDWLNFSYRIKPQKQLVIPWEHIKSEYKWAAMDSDGEVFIFTRGPVKGLCCWKNIQHSDCVNLTVSLNIDTNGIDWKQSLIERPDGI